MSSAEQIEDIGDQYAGRYAYTRAQPSPRIWSLHNIAYRSEVALSLQAREALIDLLAHYGGETGGRDVYVHP